MLTFKMKVACIILLFVGLAAAGRRQRCKVAFSAFLTKHLSVPAGQTVVYNEYFVNVGGGYDTQTGIFTCPAPGLYFFQFHGLSQHSKTVWLKLYHNDIYAASFWGKANSGYGGSGNSVILKLAKGDQVQVKAASATDLYGVPHDVYATFSGYPISCDKKV